VVLPGLAAAAPVDDVSWWGSEGILSWVSVDTKSKNVSPDAAGAPKIYTVEFITYLSRFLLNFDDSCAKWWRARKSAVPLSYGKAQRKALEAKSFAAFAASVEYGLRRYPGADGPGELLASLARQHGFDTERRRHLALAFSFLGPAQPRAGIARLLVGVDEVQSTSGGLVETILPPAFSPALPDYMAQDFLTLLPKTQRPVLDARGELYEVRGLVVGGAPARRPRSRSADSIFGAQGDEGFFQERPLTQGDFGLFALAGAVGCSLTHALVVPIDVVKTRLQTAPGRYAGLREGMTTMYAEEGLSSLFTGAAPTLLGYLWYGITVYPGYELLKRLLEATAGSANAVEFHGPLVVCAGALATTIACVGVCPAETCRIRMVAQPLRYATLGATVRTIAEEDGAATFYAGFRPLLVRQVIFGMVKFFFFDSLAETIYSAAPQLHDDAASRLFVSLLAGLIAGSVSSLVSQPADTILSTMNRGTNKLGIFDAAKQIYNDRGPGGFYLGAGARCVWSGAVISGQFFFYDLVRSAFHVSADELRLLLDINL